jgi:hypothetical protein
MDVDSIEPGLDFVAVLNEQVSQCDLLLAVIGRGWLNATDANGARRLDNSDDFVRVTVGCGGIILSAVLLAYWRRPVHGIEALLARQRLCRRYSARQSLQHQRVGIAPKDV